MTKMTMSDRPEIHTALITHEHGTEHYVAASERALLAQLADFCREHWAEERQRHSSLPEVAPDDNVAAIETYFELVCEENLERGTASLAPLGDLRGLNDDALATSHARLQLLAAALLRQRGALAGERVRRWIAKLAPKITNIGVSFEQGRLELATVAFDEAGQPVDLEPSIPAADRPQLDQLLAEAAVTGPGPHVIQIAADDDSRSSKADTTAGEQAAGIGEKRRDTEAILARIKRELPARSGERRARWTVAALQGAALARIAEEDHEDRDDPLAALDRIAEIGEQLIAARTSPGSRQGAAPVIEAQVGYLVPLEVVVDLEQARVARVVVIDEAIELDPEEGARASGTLAPLPPAQAHAAVAIAELVNGGDWPAMEFGW
jgi:hypothetical protein